MARRITSRAVVFTGLVAAAFSLISCGAIDQSVTTSATSSNLDKKITRQSRTYAYSTGSERAVPSRATQPVTYHGSAPYICSPSGFGQKSRCFLRT